MTFGERILKLRTEKGMTQDELAQKLGYKSRSSIAKIENGARDVPRSQIVDLAKALDTTPSVLMGWEDEVLAAPIEAKPDDASLKFALFGDADVDDEVLDDVKRYAKIARQMREEKKKE